ncbi:MAG TPA: GAF domain-containing protein [Candidatus Acidoferrales bacterium]|jgi:CheY-like chemotaxis protein|nr:GAF domain-containing protein [Candidatus Acidoferrales bacterium]
MVAIPKSVGVGRCLGMALGLCLALASLPVAGQTKLSFDQLESRKQPDFTPLYEGRSVSVRGVVATGAYRVPGYTLLGIQDPAGGGVLQLPLGNMQLYSYHPGDELQVEGTVSSLFGAVTVVPTRIAVVDRKRAPEALQVPVRELMGIRYIGMLVRTEGKVTEASYNSGGAYLMISSADGSYKLFVPQSPDRSMPSIDRFTIGDTVRATGMAFQYCFKPPYNRWFELVVRDTGDIVTAERSWFLPPLVIAGGLGVLLVGGFVVWGRERRLRNQRKRLKTTYQLGEEILGASSPETILKRISGALPGILGVTGLRLYVFNRGMKTLDRMVDDGTEPASISLSSPPGGTPAGAVACFHYRTLLVIPDIARSPFPIAGKEGDVTPKSLLFVPMLAQNEVIGVLQLDQDDRVRNFTADEQALAQHLGNQIGVAIRLMDQRSVQEQLFRTEKLAAVGRLISGVVNELQTPLSSISELAHKALEKAHGSAAEREVAAIGAEARKAAAMVARLVSFAAAEQVEARQVEINGLLRNLIEFREGDWKASGIRVRDLTSREPLFVIGSQGQLEQVFLNLFVHVEQSLAQAEVKSLTIRTSLIARRLLVEISFTSLPELRKMEDTASVLGVTRSVIAGHGGEVRLIEKNNTEPRFEVELPASMRDRSTPAIAAAGAPVRESSRRMTALVIEPEEAAQRQILALLAVRGFRVVPVTNSDTGLELAQRMRFDAAFCSIHAPGLNWVELSERMQSRTGGFVLLSDGYDAELSADFEGDGRFVLPKPVQELELDRVLRLLEPVMAQVIPISKTGTA